MKFNPSHTTIPPVEKVVVTEIPNEEFDKIEKAAPVEVGTIKKMVSPTVAVNVRIDPDSKSSSLGVIYPGTEYEVEDFDKKWYKITSGDKKGAYVLKDFVE